MANIKTNLTDTVALASGASGSSKFFPVGGAVRVNIAVSCDVAHLLTAGTITLQMENDKTVNITPAALPTGADGTTVEINCGGIVTGVDLSTTYAGVIVRSMLGNGTTGPYGMSMTLSGVKAVRINLTKAATAGTATYTVVCTPYYY